MVVAISLLLIAVVRCADSGFLDQDEVKVLGTNLMRAMGRLNANTPVPDMGNAQVDMGAVDEDNDGTLNFDE